MDTLPQLTDSIIKVNEGMSHKTQYIDSCYAYDCKANEHSEYLC